MIAIDLESTVGQLVRELPARSRVFEQLKIDYCCGGKISLRDACRRRQISPEEVLKKLDACQPQSPADVGPVDADAMDLTELADHVEQTHHAYLKRELPRLDFMTEKVARVHGEHEPRLHDVRRAFVAFREEVEPHMLKEERVLFPMIRELEASSGVPDFHCGSLANPINQMEHEHDQAGDALEIMRTATDDFTPPSWACNTYRAMLDALEELEQDMHQHVHKENNVMFPKAIELETQRRQAACGVGEQR